MRFASARSTPIRRGAVLFKFAVCLPALVAVVALNSDGGRLMDERRRVQSAADSAALAAGADLYSNYWTNHSLDPNGTARLAAEQIASANGYPASAVSVHIPPQSGSYAGKAGYVEVAIDTSLEASFSRAISGESLGVTARAVARGAPMDIGIILLRGSGAGAFQNTAAAFALVNKPLIVDSNDPVAFQSTGLLFLSLSRIDVTGGMVNSSVLPITTRVRTGVRPTFDPLMLLPIPDSSTAVVRSTAPMTINSLLPTTLQPGVYKGGLHVTGLSVVVMAPGIYIMEGGGFQVDGLATLAGLGVMVYNGSSSSYADGPITVNSLGKVVLVAPLSGTYQGLNFFQQRNMTQPLSVTGTGLTTITGVVYAAKAHVTLTGSAAIGLDILGGAYVADSMTTSGVGAVTVNLGLNPPRVPDVRLVE